MRVARAVAVLIVACCVVAGCGRSVQGSVKDSALDQGVGEQFQKLIPAGTAVRDVRCVASRSLSGGFECDITMMRNNPDPGYRYVVTETHRHAFHALLSSINTSDHWIPPNAFEGGY